MKYYFLNCLIVAVILIGFSVARANGFGIKLDQAVGDYIVNVDADTYNFISGESVSFIFQLWDKERTEMVNFDNVWVGITRAQQENFGFGNLFGGFLGKPDFGGFRMTSVLPDAGNYVLSVRYGKLVEKKTETTAEGFFLMTETIVEASFPITIEKNPAEIESQPLRNSLVSGILGLIIGSMFILWLKRK